MKVAAWIVGLCFAAWSGLWFVGAMATERVIGGWLSARAEEGWLVNYAELDTSGYPGRFETRLIDLQLADPETGWAWIAPQFQLSQASYRPTHIRAVWPDTQSLASPFERLEIESASMVAEVDVAAGTDLALERTDMAMADVSIVSTEGWRTLLPEAGLNVTRQEGSETLYDVRFEAASVVPPEPVTAVLDPAGVLPEAMDLMRYEAVMGFDRQWDITALEVSRPQITSLDLSEMRAQWGDLLFRASGRLEVDADGYPSGEIAVRAENWRAMVEMGVNAGVIPADARGAIERALGFIAGLSGQPENIDAPLSFRNQLMFFGPLPIGQAPRLVLR